MKRALAFCVPLTASLASSVSMVALSLAPAQAACTLSNGDGIVVDCQDRFDATLEFLESPDVLVLTQGESQVRVPGSEFEDTNFLTLNGESAADQITVTTITSSEVTLPFLVSILGNDNLLVEEGTLNGGFLSSGGVDIITVRGGVVNGSIAGDGTNQFTISGGVVNGQLGGGILVDETFRVGLNGTYVYDITGGIINGSVQGGNFIDTFNIANATVNGFVAGNGGDDEIVIAAGTVIDASFLEVAEPRAVSGGAGDDVITTEETSVILGRIVGNEGDDIIDVAGSVRTIDSESAEEGYAITGFDGDDTIIIRETAVVEGNVRGQDGNDTIEVFGEVDGTLDVFGRSIQGGTGNDAIIIGTSALITGPVRGEDGADTIRSAGTVNGLIEGGNDDDRITVSGGSVAGVDGGEGIDTFTLSGGVLDGPVTAFEDVTIDPTLSETDIAGALDFTGGEAASINIANFDVPSIGNGSPITSFTLSGFSNGVISDSVIRTLTGTLGVQSLTVNNSTLGFSGASFLGNPGTGNLVLNNSTLDFINGSAGDTLSVGSVGFNSSTLGIDVDPVSVGVSDEIIVNGGPGSFTASGENVVLVNFTDPVDLTQAQQIPIIGVSGTEAGTFAQNFTPVAVGENASPTLALNVLDGPGGGLLLETREIEEFVPPPAAVNVSQAMQGGELVADINTDLVDSLTSFSPASERVVITPTFGIFANGQFGRTNHDGFDVTGGGFDQSTPSFTSDAFSLVGVAELDASAEFGLADNDIGLKLSAFGGYVQNDVEFSRDLGNGNVTRFRGDGDNTGGVIGGTVLASQIQGLGNLNYGLFSGALFIGESSVTNADTGGVGDYATTGQVFSVKVGRNMPIADRVRLDLRGGASYQMFRGTSFVDSSGVAFGSSVTSFGVLSFEPGLSTVVQVGNLVVSPALRGILQQRVGYRNEATIAGTDFDFDDADFTAGAQLGASVKFNENVSGGAFIEGRFSDDYNKVLGKLAIKYTIPRS